MAPLTALIIVRQRIIFVNRLGFSVVISPLVQFISIEPNPLFSYGEFPYMRTDGFVENP